MVYVRFKGIPQTDILMRNAMTYITLCVWNSRSNENTVCFRHLAVHWSPSRLLTQGPPPLSALISAQTHKDGAQHAIKLAVLLMPLSVCPFLLCSPSAPHDLPECSHRSVEMPAQVTSRSGTVWCCEPVLLSGSPGFLLWCAIAECEDKILPGVSWHHSSGRGSAE